MTYTPNVPQGSQQISTTQPLIEANFTFLNSDLQIDHVFNGNGVPALEGTHKQASMANMADPVSLPPSVNGIYYVSGGDAKFFGVDGAEFIQTTPNFQFILQGDLNLAKGSPVGFDLPSSSVGNYYLKPPTGILPSGPATASAVGMFVTRTSEVNIAAVSDPGIDVTNPSGIKIFFEPSSTSSNGTYRYLVVYFKL